MYQNSPIFILLDLRETAFEHTECIIILYIKTLFLNFLIFLIEMERLKKLKLSESLIEAKAPYNDTQSSL